MADVVPMTEEQAHDWVLLDMLGPVLADAIRAARARLDDGTILVRIAVGRCAIERGGEVVMEGLTEDEAVGRLGALE